VSFLGGDGVRVWQLVRKQTPLTIAVRSVLLDRATGLLMLLLLVVVALPFLLTLTTDALFRMVLLLIALSGGAATVALLTLGAIPTRFHRGRLITHLVEISSDARNLMFGPRYGPFCLLSSLAIHLLNVAAVYVLARGLAAPISLWYVILLTPTILLLSMLPISYAGWGVREGAMVFMFGLVGVPHDQSLAVSVTFGLTSLLVSILAGAASFVGDNNSLLSPRSPTVTKARSTARSEGVDKSSVDLRVEAER
jgi:uncharacterized membrane protein YbhN (UPF0104 family)